MSTFAIFHQTVSVKVRAQLVDERLIETFADLLTLHRHGDAGELGADQAERNRRIIAQWNTGGRDCTDSAVRSQYTLCSGTILYLVTCHHLTWVSTRDEYASLGSSDAPRRFADPQNREGNAPEIGKIEDNQNPDGTCAGNTFSQPPRAMVENPPLLAEPRLRCLGEILASTTLEFVSPKEVEGYVAAARRLRGQGRRNFLVRTSTSALPLAREVHARISADLRDVDCALEVGPASTRLLCPEASAVAYDAVFLLEPCARTLSAALMDFVSFPASIVAPITEHFFRKRALFMISVPKSGTHMLFELLGAFNLTYAGQARGPLSPQHFYFLSSENSHTLATEFFGRLADLPQGGADHPFFVTPTLFMYRNPLDVVVSEAFYYADPRNTPLAYYFSSFSLEERLLRLIGDDPLLGNLRRRLVRYLPWLRLPNVIPISFEELVGPKGDGTLVEQLKTIWSLQLKLHVPGSPAYYAAAVFRQDTPTFRKGAINSHVEHLTQGCYAALREERQDFLHEFGYDLEDRFQQGYLPRFVNRFRRRHLVLKPPARAANTNASAAAHPFSSSAVYAYRGYLAGAAGRVYGALPQDTPRPVDPRLEAGGSVLQVASSWEELVGKLDANPLADVVSPPQIVPDMHVTDLFQLDPPQPVLALADVCGFNVVHFNHLFYCLAIRSWQRRVCSFSGRIAPSVMAPTVRME
jgi:hypothetical protein